MDESADPLISPVVTFVDNDAGEDVEEEPSPEEEPKLSRKQRSREQRKKRKREAQEAAQAAGQSFRAAKRLKFSKEQPDIISEQSLLETTYEITDGRYQLLLQRTNYWSRSM